MPTFHLQTNGRRRCGHAACPKPAGRHSHPSLNWGFAPPPLPAVPGDRVSSSQIIAGTSGRRGRPGRHLFACLLPPPPPAAVTAPWRCLLSVSLPAPRLPDPPPASSRRPVKGGGSGNGQARGCELHPAWQHCNPSVRQCNPHTATHAWCCPPHTPIPTRPAFSCLPARPPACLPAVCDGQPADRQADDVWGHGGEVCLWGAG